MEFYEQSFEGLGEAVAGHMAKHGQWPASILDLEDPRSRKWAKIWHVQPVFDDKHVEPIFDDTIVRLLAFNRTEWVWRDYYVREFVEPDSNNRTAVSTITSRIWSYYSQEGRLPSAEDGQGIFEGLADGWSLVRVRKIFSSAMQVTVSWEDVGGNSQRMIVITDSGFLRIDLKS